MWDHELVRHFRSYASQSVFPTLVERDQSASFDTRLWHSAQSAGLFSLLANPKTDFKDLARAYYGLAWGGLDLPLTCSLAAHALIAPDLIQRFGTEEQKSKYLPGLFSGEKLGAICNSEAGTSTDLRKIQSRCRVNGNETAQLEIYKPCVTNGFNASILLVSAWIERSGAKPTIGVFVLEGTDVSTVDLTPTLASFRTGITGSVRANISNFRFQERMLAGNPFHIFKHCFNLERLMIAVIVAGFLRGLEDEALDLLAARDQLAQMQWVQDKVLTLYLVRTKLESLIERVIGHPTTLDSYGPELATLKLLVNVDAAQAALAFFELVGHRALGTQHFAQKAMRDMAAFRFFGGTQELQKMSLFEELLARRAKIEKSSIDQAS